MAYYLGPVYIDQGPVNTASAVFPVSSQLGWQSNNSPKIVTHTFGEGDAKVEQRFYIGPGTTKFVVNLQPMSPRRRSALINFWNQLGGPQNAFFYDAPNDDSETTTRYTVIFDPAQALTWTQANDLIASAQVTLVVILNESQYEQHPISATVTRFPSSSLQTALLQQVQEVIPLVTITPFWWHNSESQITFGAASGDTITVFWQSKTATSVTLYIGDPLNPSVPATVVATGTANGSARAPGDVGTLFVLVDNATGRVIASNVLGGTGPIFLSDRLCAIGGNGYYPRLLGHQGISQQLGPADNVTFQFGNADRAFTTLKGLVNLNRADVQFCLFHVGTQTLIQVWRGEIKDWTADEGPVFQITCSDSVYELTLPYPQRTITRDCWKTFNDGKNCPYASVGNGGGDPGLCDKGFDTVNGCQAHGMDNYFGGIIANPQGTNIRDNSQSGRPVITATSIVSDTMYGKPLQQVYTNIEMPVNCIIADGRDESAFYEALGIVGEGPIGSFGAPQNQLLDGQTQNFPYTPIECLGNDPEPTPFSLDAGGKFQYPYKAAGVARLNIRRTDTNGIQPSSPDQHTMVATVSQGVRGLVWSAPGTNSVQTLTNPVWVAVNALLKAKGLGIGTPIDQQEAQFDVNSAVAAAAICDLQVPTLVYNRNPVPLPVDGANMGANQWTSFNPTQSQLPNETQFQFIGVIAQQQPLRDWLDQILINCVGYWYTVFGKIYFGIRENASAVEAFTTGNMLFKSYSEKPVAPKFDDLTGSFADRDFQFAQNTARYYDQDYAIAMGVVGPRYEKGQINLAGTCTASQAMRILATRGREELGGVNEFEWKNAVTATWKTTVLSLNTAVGQVVSVSHPAVAGGYGKFRIEKWVLNFDYSIQIVARTVTDSMYDLTVGPKPIDVIPPWLPTLPGIQTDTIPEWAPTSVPRGGAATIGIPNASTFSFSAEYAASSDGSLRVDLAALGLAPVTEYFSSLKPTIGSVSTSSGSGSLIAGTTYYFAVCGMDANGNLSAPSAVGSIIIPAGSNTATLANIVFPVNSVNYVLFVGATREQLRFSASGALTGTLSFGSVPNGTAYGMPPDDWSNVRLRLKAKEVIRHGIQRPTIIGVAPAAGQITVELGLNYASYLGWTLSLVGDPAGGTLASLDYIILSVTSGTVITLGIPGTNNPAYGHPLQVGQIMALRAQAVRYSATTIGSSWFSGGELPNGLPINGDTGKSVRIIGGTGVGQVRQIASNDANTHTVSQPWSTVPDGTSIYIVEGSDYLWQNDSPVLRNWSPQTIVTVPLTVPGLTSDVTGLLILGVLFSNGFEGEEEFAPFRDLALFLEAGLTPSTSPLQGSWWNAVGYGTPGGYITATPFAPAPNATQVIFDWVSYFSGPSEIRALQSPGVLGPVLGSSPTNVGTAVPIPYSPGAEYFLVDSNTQTQLATIICGNFPFPAGGGANSAATAAVTSDTVINYGNYNYPGMKPFPSGVFQNYFYARWVGEVWAPVSGLYTFGVNSDDGSNLYVNGKQLVNRLGGSQGMAPNLAYTDSAADFYLVGQRSYSIVLEYWQQSGGAGVQLLWTPPGASSPSLISFSPQQAIDSSTLLNGQGSIVPAQSIQLEVLLNYAVGGVWNLTIGWSGGIPRADQSVVSVPPGKMSWSNLTPGTAYIYAYIDPGSGRLHLASGDAPAPPPSSPSSAFALACYYDGRIPVTPLTVTASTIGSGESGSLAANPSTIAQGTTQAVTLNWSSTSPGVVAVFMGSPSGTQLATGASGSFTTAAVVNAGTGFYLVDTNDSVVLASVIIGDGASGSGGDYGAGSQGGSGVCPEENCLVYVQGRGVVRAGDLKRGDWLRGEDRSAKHTVYRQVVSVRREYSSVWRTVLGQRVSPLDDVSIDGGLWVKPYKIGKVNTDPGCRIAIEIEARTYDDRNYHIVDADGQTLFLMHNYLVSC